MTLTLALKLKVLLLQLLGWVLEDGIRALKLVELYKLCSQHHLLGKPALEPIYISHISEPREIKKRSLGNRCNYTASCWNKY